MGKTNFCAGIELIGLVTGMSGYQQLSDDSQGKNHAHACDLELAQWLVHWYTFHPVELDSWVEVIRFLPVY